MNISWLADKIEQWPTTKLLPYARNARTHSDQQVAQIAASIAEFGFTNPILSGSDGVIVAGHGRLAAAQKLGLNVVPVVVLDHLTPTQRRALVIADNRIAENADWDERMLALELAALQDEAFDLNLTGFDTDDLLNLLSGEETTSEGITDEDNVPEVPGTPVSRPGDVWICGKHRVLCGDATDPENYLLLLGNEIASMSFTDPPYNVNYANSAKDKLRGKNRAILNDDLGDGLLRLFIGVSGANAGPLSWAASTSRCRHRNWTPCSRPFVQQAGTSPPSSSGPRTRLRWDVPTISVSTSRCSTDGAKEASATGAAIGIRATCGRSRSP
jgi:hypothetical protein